MADLCPELALDAYKMITQETNSNNTYISVSQKLQSIDPTFTPDYDAFAQKHTESALKFRKLTSDLKIYVGTQIKESVRVSHNSHGRLD